jgi:hypothetical protein
VQRTCLPSHQAFRSILHHQRLLLLLLLLHLPLFPTAVVPHSSIFEHAEDLPSFNSNAIEANVHHIPHLSSAFIVMNDDFFLTSPWALSDFVREDGSEVSHNDRQEQQQQQQRRRDLYAS